MLHRLFQSRLGLLVSIRVQLDKLQARVTQLRCYLLDIFEHLELEFAAGSVILSYLIKGLALTAIHGLLLSIRPWISLDTSRSGILSCLLLGLLAGALLEADAAEVEAEAVRDSGALFGRGERVSSNMLLVVLVVRPDDGRPLSILGVGTRSLRRQSGGAVHHLRRGVFLFEEGSRLGA